MSRTSIAIPRRRTVAAEIVLREIVRGVVIAADAAAAVDVMGAAAVEVVADAMAAADTVAEAATRRGSACLRVA